MDDTTQTITTPQETSQFPQFALPKVRFEEVENKDLHDVSFVQGGGEPQSEDNDRVFFIPRRAIEIIEVRFVHDMNSTSASFNLECLPSGTPVGSGTVLFTVWFDTSANQGYIQTKTRTDFISTKVNGHLSTQIFPGESLSVRRSGNRTNLRGVCMTVFYKYIGKGDYR